MTRLSFRLGTNEDIPALQSLQLSSGEPFREIGMESVADNPPTQPSLFRASISEKLLLVVEAEGTMAGFALLRSADKDCHLEQMSVGRPFLGQGIGTKLLTKVLELCSEHGFGRVTLSTFKEVQWNQPFYAKHGFRPLSEANLNDRLQSIRLQEEEAGLNLDERVIMVRAL